MCFLSEQTWLLDQWAEGPHLEVPVWRVLKCQCHTCHPAWLQLAVIVTEIVSRGRTSCLTHSLLSQKRQFPVSSQYSPGRLSRCPGRHSVP